MVGRLRGDLLRVTMNLILFRETGVLDRELNLASVPYMGSPEGLRHCCLIYSSPSISMIMPLNKFALPVHRVLRSGGARSACDTHVQSKHLVTARLYTQV